MKRMDAISTKQTQAPRTRRIHEERREKLAELADCPECSACYREGRWTWRKAPMGSYQHTCPACKRIATNDPAGLIRCQGKFVTTHRAEIEGLLRNVEERQRKEHPLKRIMSIEDAEPGFVVSVTDAKLALAFGKSLAKAYGGDLQHPPTTADQADFVRVHWTRDESA